MLGSEELDEAERPLVERGGHELPKTFIVQYDEFLEKVCGDLKFSIPLPSSPSLFR